MVEQHEVKSLYQLLSIADHIATVKCSFWLVCPWIFCCKGILQLLHRHASLSLICKSRTSKHGRNWKLITSIVKLQLSAKTCSDAGLATVVN